MSECEGFIPALVDAASNELSPEARPAFERHLQTCADCRKELAALSGTTALLTATRDEPDPLTLSGFTYRTTLAAESRRHHGPTEFWSRWGRSLRALVYAATAASAVALALFVVPTPELPVAPAPVSLDEIATASELRLWQMYTDDASPSMLAESMGRAEVFSLDDGLADLTDAELDELIQLLNDGSQG